MNCDTLPWHLHLTDTSASLPGTALAALDGEATVDFSDGAHFYLRTPRRRSRAEIRWVADQVLRKARALHRLGAVTLHSEIADTDLLRTLALDLHHATKGELTWASEGPVADDVRRIGVLEDGVRSWINEDPSTRTSLAIAKDVTDWARGHDSVAVEVLDEKPLAELGLALLLAVGQGSDVSPARLVIARYRPKGAQGAPLMLLGKGITFDTGGINVKPYEAYVSHMKNDMAGAALAWGLFKGLVQSGYPKPLTLALPTCENAVGSRSMRPGAVVQSYRGPSVRIDHTDAEGRLVLADALAYVGDVDAPEQVLCFATLTTAALIAYGPFATPVHFAAPEFASMLEAAGERNGEDLHVFPRRIWHEEANKDQEADLRNTARLAGEASRGAGSRNAAHFLAHFTDRPLVHFDIFASAWNWSGEAPGAGYGATGAPFRTVFDALEAQARGV